MIVEGEVGEEVDGEGVRGHVGMGAVESFVGAGGRADVD
jgi:hypothetical protein